MKKRIKIKDWYTLPSWGRGLAVGAIVGAILIIPSAFLVKSYVTIPIPFIVFISCLVTGVLVSRNKKSFGLSHK